MIRKTISLRQTSTVFTQTDHIKAEECDEDSENASLSEVQWFFFMVILSALLQIYGKKLVGN